MTTFFVKPITKKQAEYIVTRKHYSRRPSVFWEAFALVLDDIIVGVVVYGQPSPPINRHAFRDREFRLYELSRLVIQPEHRNAASMLVGRSLRMLSQQPCAVVSYADSEWGHAGIVYQATNWLYTGATRSHDHAYIVDGQRLHPMSLRDRGVTNPKQWAKENNVQTAPPMDKHRYFYLSGNKYQKQDMRNKLTYPVLNEYPKTDKRTYDAGAALPLHITDIAADAWGLA